MIIIADYNLILAPHPSKPCIMKKSILFPILLVTLILLLTLTGFAQTDSVVKFVNPPSVSSPKGFSQAVQIDLGTQMSDDLGSGGI